VLSSSVVAKAFSRACDSYEVAAQPQKIFACRLVELLERAGRAQHPKHILELGAGTGALSRQLLSLYPGASLTVVDISSSMLHRLSRSVESENLQCITSDIQQLEFPEQVELIASSSTLHWLNDIERVLHQSARAIVPGGQLLFSFMVDGTLRELQEVKQELFPGVGTFPYLAVDTFRDTLAASGFRIALEERDVLEQWYRGPRKLMWVLKQMGVTRSPHIRVLNKRELLALEARYAERFATESGEVPATYVSYRVVAVRG